MTQRSEQRTNHGMRRNVQMGEEGAYEVTCIIRGRLYDTVRVQVPRLLCFLMQSRTQNAVHIQNIRTALSVDAASGHGQRERVLQ